ncbi:MAG TPA: hypothetical protein VNH83_22365 [Bryobacteraceae bacterium]|nr:hypothetical protein [Bryobacteraceae bacterium]
MDRARERLLRLLPPGSADRSHNIEIASELSQMRTTQVSIPAPRAGSAEFFLIFANNEKNPAVVVEDSKFIKGSEQLKFAEAALRSAKFNVSFPADGQPRLLRRGILFCSAQPGCSFTLLNPEDLSSIN